MTVAGNPMHDSTNSPRQHGIFSIISDIDIFTNFDYFSESTWESTQAVPPKFDENHEVLSDVYNESLQSEIVAQLLGSQ